MTTSVPHKICKNWGESQINFKKTKKKKIQIFSQTSLHIKNHLLFTSLGFYTACEALSVLQFSCVLSESVSLKDSVLKILKLQSLSTWLCFFFFSDSTPTIFFLVFSSFWILMPATLPSASFHKSSWEHHFLFSILNCKSSISGKFTSKDSSVRETNHICFSSHVVHTDSLASKNKFISLSLNVASSNPAVCCPFSTNFKVLNVLDISVFLSSVFEVGQQVQNAKAKERSSKSSTFLKYTFKNTPSAGGDFAFVIDLQLWLNLRCRNQSLVTSMTYIKIFTLH